MNQLIGMFKKNIWNVCLERIRGRSLSWPRCVSYLSLIGKSIGADDAFVKLNRGFGIARLVFVPEVHIVQAKPLGVAFIPLKLVQQGPCGVALHIDSIFDSLMTQQRVSWPQKDWAFKWPNKRKAQVLMSSLTFQHLIDVVFIILYPPVITQLCT